MLARSCAVSFSCHGGSLGPDITVVVAGKTWDELVAYGQKLFRVRLAVAPDGKLAAFSVSAYPPSNSGG